MSTKINKLERAHKRFPRTMSILLMALLPFASVRFMWHAVKDDIADCWDEIKDAYLYLWLCLRAGKHLEL